MVRAFFVDGYGHDVGLVTLWYAPAAEPRVAWRMPKPRNGEDAMAPIDATLTLSAWREVTAAGTYFDRALAQLPQKERSICLHGWTTRVEMVEADGKIRRGIQSGCGDDALVWPLARRMTAAAIAAMPACALLDAEKTRNDITRLNKCNRLSGDRAAAAEATNVYDAPWFANPRGEDFTRALTYLFAEQLDVAWPGEPVVTDGEAAARIWSRHVGTRPSSPRDLRRNRRQGADGWHVGDARRVGADGTRTPARNIDLGTLQRIRFPRHTLLGGNDASASRSGDILQSPINRPIARPAPASVDPRR